jgi:hypothetical protein
LVKVICPTRKVENFSRPDWTGGIALNRFEKFGFARNAREGVRAPPSVRSSGLTLTIERYGRHEEMLVTVQRRDMTVSLILLFAVGRGERRGQMSGRPGMPAAGAPCTAHLWYAANRSGAFARPV